MARKSNNFDVVGKVLSAKLRANVAILSQFKNFGLPFCIPKRSSTRASSRWQFIQVACRQ